MKLTHEIIDITPALAKKWLEESSFDNRNIRKANLEKIIADIDSGLWVFDGNPIRFNQKGDVLDGQHRLTAVIRTGKTIKSLVIRGIADRAKMTIDVGAGRKTSDILHFNGVSNSIPLAVAGRLMVGYVNHGGDLSEFAKTKVAGGISAQKICNTIEENQDLIDSHNYVCNKRNSNKMLGRGVSSFLHCILSRTEYGYMADEFFDRLDDGIGLEDGSPIAALRSVLMLGIKTGGNSRVVSAIKCALVIKAWNLYVKDRNVKYIRWSLKEPFPALAA